MQRNTPPNMQQCCTRRAWLLRSAAIGGVLGGIGVSRSALAATEDTLIVQPADATAQAFMERAFAMRRRAEETGDQSSGAVVVRAGRIVGEAPSRVILHQDPTAHAEMEAIRDAARRLGTRSLSGCVLYSSSRACPMCEAAAYWAGIDGMFHGTSITDAGSPRLGRC